MCVGLFGKCKSTHFASEAEEEKGKTLPYGKKLPVGRGILHYFLLLLHANMEKLLTDTEIQWLRSNIDSAERIVLCGHVGPDGDALGSTLALYHWLLRKGKKATVVVPNLFPDFLQWLPGSEDIQIYCKAPEGVSLAVGEADMVFVVDMNVSSRLQDMEQIVLDRDVPRILIDHHLDPDRNLFHLVLSHPEMCAASEVICHLLWQLGELDNLTMEEATCLYAGMMCDTGAFTFNSTRPVVYECISRLLARGIDKDWIYRQVFFTASEARLRLQGYLLYVNMKVLKGMNASIMTLTNEERRRFSCKNGDTEGFVNIPLQILGMRLSVFLNQNTEKPEMIKVSLRSVDNFPCNEMAAQFFNGGGHKNASGGHLYGTMEEAVKTTEKAIHAYVDKLKATN